MDFVHYHAPAFSNEALHGAAPATSHEMENDAIPRQVHLDDRTTRLAEEQEDPDALATEENEGNEVSTRPRLTPDQVGKLEESFSILPKPNSATKRQLAVETGLSHQRVANWFQNRRAKAKQAKKQEEFEIMRTGGPSGPLTQESFSMNDFIHSLDSSRTPRGLTEDGAAIHTYPCYNDGPFHLNQYQSPSDASYASLQRSLAVAQAAYSQGNFNDSNVQMLNGAPVLDESAFTPARLYNQNYNENGVTYPPSESAYSEWGSCKASPVRWAPTHQPEDQININNANSQQAHSTLQDHRGFQGFSVSYADAIKPTNFEDPYFVTGLPFEALPEAQHGPVAFSTSPPASNEGIYSRRVSCSSELIQHLNNVQIEPQPAGEPVFKQQEAPTNLAVRRQRRRPAALGNASMRSHSYIGSTPVSPNGNGSYLGPSLPMRRIKSTGNNLNSTRGRIQKHVPGSAQRSPLYFESFPDVALFEDAQFADTTPTTSQSISFSGSLAPPTPLSPLDIGCWQSDAAEMPLASESSLSRSLENTWCYNPDAIGSQPSLVSPPNTPLDYENRATMYHVKTSQHSPFPSAPQTGFIHYSPPQSSASPENSSLSSTLHMPQPQNISRLSYGEQEIPNHVQHAGHSPDQRRDTHLASHGKTIPEFHFVEFPQQPPSQEPPHHKVKEYVFSHQTPSDFHQS